MPYPQRTYLVRYPSGKPDTVTAHDMRIRHDGTIELKKAPGDNPGNIVFTATPSSGVTITDITEDAP